jgi:hypothetical protein
MRDFSVRWALLCAGAGAIVYALQAFGVLFPHDYPHFGTDIYDSYFYRMMDGRLDLPIRLLRLEGHYNSDGVGVLYHGPAPLLTRLFLVPFVTLQNFPTAAFSIWLWAMLGTGFYHLTLFQVLRKFTVNISRKKVTFLLTLLGVGIWFSGPGMLMSANISLYNEPISITYAAMAISVYIMMRSVFFNMPFGRFVVILSVLAGITLFARPHFAVGLYAGVMLTIYLSWRCDAKRSIASWVGALLILLAFGVAFLQLNVARFGSMTQAHGGVEQPINSDEVLYGPVFWGQESAQSRRLLAFEEHGRFHPWRILPNIGIYIFDLPKVDWIGTLHARITEPVSGFGRIGYPAIGLILLWPIWLAFLGAGLIYARPRISGGIAILPVLTATSLAGLLILSYPTVTIRYRFEIWPILFVLCVLCLPGLMRRFEPNGQIHQRTLSLSVGILMLGVILSAVGAFFYSNYALTVPGSWHEEWDYTFCEKLVRKKGFLDENIPRLCADPDSVY